MARVSRRESTARTRERLLDAAAEVFAEKGFAGASIDEIALRAGHTKGAVYSHFSGKDDLFLALIDHQLGADRIGPDGGLDDIGDAAALLGRLRAADVMPSHGDRTRFLLFSEFRLYALRNPEVGRRLAEWERAALAELAERVDVIVQQLDLTPPVPAARLAALLQCLGAGLELFHHLDPDGPTRASIADAIRLVLAASPAGEAAATAAAPPDAAGAA
ncbi:MAG TPA: helix-turn-helix domain-containing protein [Acidimicrobiales bacterium]